MLANIFELMIHINIIFNGLIGMNISDNYVDIFFSTRQLSHYEPIPKFHLTFNASFYKWVQNLSIYSVYNQVSGVNIFKNHVIISLNYSYFN